jgi:hypothetical protein
MLYLMSCHDFYDFYTMQCFEFQFRNIYIQFQYTFDERPKISQFNFP